VNRTALLSLTLLAACGPSATRRRADVEECSKVHEQAQLIALCLMSDHKWPEAEANAAGRARESEFIGIRAAHEDSLWSVAAQRHRQEIRQCPGRWRDMAACLEAAGWPAARAQRAGDSAWTADSAEHRRQIGSCLTRERTANIAACLQLYYGWSPERGLRANDSVRAAQGR